MSIGEVARRVESYERTYQRKLKDKASFDWILGNLIGISVGRCLDSDATYPEIYEAYPTILLESLSFGKTIVSTPTKGAVEILENLLKKDLE